MKNPIYESLRRKGTKKTPQWSEEVTLRGGSMVGRKRYRGKYKSYHFEVGARLNNYLDYAGRSLEYGFRVTRTKKWK